MQDQIMDLPAQKPNPSTEQKLVFRMDNYHSALQKSLHKQWIDGQNCDLVMSTQSCNFSVHSCVVAAFSTKISDQLLQASVTKALASITGRLIISENALKMCLSSLR
jgi:hypothetical protein